MVMIIEVMVEIVSMVVVVMMMVLIVLRSYHVSSTVLSASNIEVI